MNQNITPVAAVDGDFQTITEEFAHFGRTTATEHNFSDGVEQVLELFVFEGFDVLLEEAEKQRRGHHLYHFVRGEVYLPVFLSHVPRKTSL